ncbi:hypothetical protein BJX62DRAFT_72935 [Aspergillus germanicus]
MALATDRKEKQKSGGAWSRGAASGFAMAVAVLEGLVHGGLRHTVDQSDQPRATGCRSQSFPLPVLGMAQASVRRLFTFSLPRRLSRVPGQHLSRPSDSGHGLEGRLGSASLNPSLGRNHCQNQSRRGLAAGTVPLTTGSSVSQGVWPQCAYAVVSLFTLHLSCRGMPIDWRNAF